jgi:hypothetical protein
MEMSQKALFWLLMIPLIVVSQLATMVAANTEGNTAAVDEGEEIPERFQAS